MKIEVELSDYDEHGMEASIIQTAAAQLVNSARRDLADETRRTYQSLIEAKAAEIVEATLLEPRRPTDRWGQPTGDPVTIVEYLTTEIEKYMQQKVDKDGREGSNAYGVQKPRRDWLIERIGLEPLKKEIEKEIAAIREDAAAQAKAVIADLLTKKLA